LSDAYEHYYQSLVDAVPSGQVTAERCVTAVLPGHWGRRSHTTRPASHRARDHPGAVSADR